MKIAFLTDVIDEHMTGIGIYSQALIQSILDTYPNAQFYFIDNLGDKNRFFTSKSRAKIITFYKNSFLLKKKSIWLNYLAYKLRTYPFDYIFNLDGTPHLLPFRQKEIIILHDINYLYGDRFSNIFRFFNNCISLKSTLTYAHKIITNSKKTMDDAIKVFGIERRKILTINNLPFFRKRKSKGKLLNHKPYLLAIGNETKRKNIRNLIKAFSFLKKTYSIPHNLIIIGTLSTKSNEIKQYSNTIYRKNIIYTGYITDEKKETLLRNANIFVFPSLYEGLGIPILEAAANGCPIISTPTPSADEILEGNYIKVNGNDYMSLADSIIKLLRSKPMQLNMIRKNTFIIEKYFNSIKRKHLLNGIFN